MRYITTTIYYHTLQSLTTYSTDAAILAKQPNDEWLDSGPGDRRIFRERGKRGLSRIFLFWERLLVFLLPRKLVRAGGRCRASDHLPTLRATTEYEYPSLTQKPLGLACLGSPRTLPLLPGLGNSK